MSSVYCYTSFTYSYLSRARVLVHTVKQAHPDWVICACLVDEAPENFDFKLEAEFDYVVNAKDLGIDNYLAWLFKHNIVEACTAVKGSMMMHLLEKGAEKIVYLDPDIAVFHPLSVEEKLDMNSIILTPHQITPNNTEKDIADNEMTSFQYGIYNLGFVAIRNDANGIDFARWWTKMLYRACYEDIKNGIFTDQKYCDIVPAFFDGVLIDRDPGCNVASWNLSQRTIEITHGGNILVNKSPLKFYHFTKIGSIGDVMTERYALDNFEVYELWNWYKRELELKTVSGIPNRYWYYGNYSNGEIIAQESRLLYRSREDLRELFKEPFSIGPNSYYEWVINNTEDN